MAKKPKPKVLVALAAQRVIFARCAHSLIQAAMNSSDFEFDFYMEMGCDIASARNRSVAAAKERGATHLLFVDYDMYFGPQTISKLLAHDKDIVGAAYNFRNEPPKPPRSAAVPFDGNTFVSPDEVPKEPFKCQVIGAGMLLIKMSVFDTFKGPWFMFGYDEKGELHYGEDTYFCQRAIKEGGLDVWADPTLSVKHIGEQLF